jgi:hypothetical protein
MFLPSEKMVAGLDYDDGYDPKTGAYTESPRAYVWPSDHPEYSGFLAKGEKPPLPKDLEDFALPADIARRLVSLAAAKKKVRDEEIRLGIEMRDRLGWKRIPDPSGQ